MKLSQGQIQELYKFTRQHHVEHYDLQTELVDHLANGIEAQRKETPELSFKDALKREFKKFGIGGFEKVVRKRRVAMGKRYLKMVFRFYSAYFKLPKILLSVLIVPTLSSSLFLVPVVYRYDVILGLLFAVAVTVLFVSLKNENRNDLKCVKLGRKWMLKDQIYNYGQYVGVFNLFPIIFNLPYFRELIPVYNSYVVLVFSSLITGLCLLAHVTINVIPKKADELLAEAYPEYKMI